MAVVAVVVFIVSPGGGGRQPTAPNTTFAPVAVPDAPADDDGVETSSGLAEPVPFSFLAVERSDGVDRAAIVIDGERDRTTTHSLLRDGMPAPVIEFASVFREGWVTVAGTSIAVHGSDLDGFPTIVPHVTDADDDRADREIYALQIPVGARPGMWIVDVGTSAGDPTTVTRHIDVRTPATAVHELPFRAVPVNANGESLLLNTTGPDGTSTMYLTTGDEVPRPLWQGIGLHLAWNHVVHLDCADGDEDRCSVRWSLLATGPVDGDPFVTREGWSFGGRTSPGASIASPDGAWIVVERFRTDGTGGELALVDLRDFGVRTLVGDARLTSEHGPGVAWSGDSRWVVVLDPVPRAIDVIADRRVDLGDALGPDIFIVAVRS